MTAVFSLVVTTKGRVAELERLLTTLRAQTFADFEVILSDQNADDRLAPLVERFAAVMPLRRVKSTGGASRGRNAGLPLAQAPFITFPDDDCWYPPETLRQALAMFDRHPDWDMFSGRSVDEQLRNTMGRWLDEETEVTRGNAWRAGIEFTLFTRREALARTGIFDETIGVGAGTPWGSGESTELLLRALAQGLKVMYTPEIHIHHPDKRPTYKKDVRQRDYAYARGTGRVLALHKYSLWEAKDFVIRPAGAALLSLAAARPDKCLYYFSILRGRVEGWISR